MNILNHFRELMNYHELIANITLREIKVRYKQSILGMLWAILQPLSMMVVFTVIFSYFIKMPSDNIAYPIFSYTALLPWTFFATSLSFAVPSIISNINLVTKIYFPREIFPIASVLAAFFDFCIAAVIFLVMFFFYRIPVTANILYLIPLFIIQLIFILGIVLFASAVSVYYRDVRYVMPLLIQLWMYLSPVIYPISIIPEKWKTLYMLNPMATIIDGYRRVLLLGKPPDLFFLILGGGISLLIFILSYHFFKKIEMTFADVI